MSSDIRYIVALVFVAICIIYLITKLKMHALLVLLLSALLLGIFCGVPLNDIVSSIQNGFGTLVLNVGLIYLSGTLLGIILEKTGAVKSIAESLFGKITVQNAIWLFAFCGYIISIPVNCDPGFIIISPLVEEFVKKNDKARVALYLALAIGLYSTHTLVPPTAGPTSVALVLGADFNRLIILGLITALFSTTMGCICLKVLCKDNNNYGNNYSVIEEKQEKESLPCFMHSILPVILPVVLISVGSCIGSVKENLRWKRAMDFIVNLGNPTIAMLIAVGVAFTLIPRYRLKEASNEWIGLAIETAAPTIFITAAGSALVSVIKVTPLMTIITSELSETKGGIILPFIMAAIFKTIQGSSTVAMVTTAGIFAPLLMELGVESELCALAIGAGSMICSHTNDSYFWVIQKFSGISINEVLHKQVIVSIIGGVSAFLFICLLSSF